MLTQDGENRIREEELFRERIRLEIERAKEHPKKGKIWTALNSAFGLFLLSTVAVGLISAGYARFQENLRTASDERREINKLATEINNRCRRTSKLMSTALEQNALMALYNAVELDSPTAGTYDEFKGRRLDSMVIELQSRTQQSVPKALELTDRLDAIHLKIWKSGIFKDSSQVSDITIPNEIADESRAAANELREVNIRSR